MPTTGNIAPKTVMSILKLKKPENTVLHWAVTEDSVVYHARNMFAERAVNGEYDYLFMIDSDMVMPEDTLVRLLDHDKDIVSALAFKRRFPFEPAVLRIASIVNGKPVFENLKEWTRNQLIEVEGTGFACSMIKTSVFETMGDTNYFLPTLDYSEDYSFCIRAREKGYTVYVDTSLVAGHIGEQVVYEEHYRNAQEYLKGVKSNEKESV